MLQVLPKGRLLALDDEVLAPEVDRVHGDLASDVIKVRLDGEHALRVAGRAPWQVLRDVHWPLLRGSLSSAALLVFVDCLKELPATYALRPFDFDTLAVVAYQYASDERLELAAAPALVIVAVGLVPVALLARGLVAAARIRAVI